MANKKFSEFVLKTSTSDVSHIVGYNGADNVQITPANFVTGGGTGVFLPLAGGTMTGNTIHNDNVKSIYGSPGNDLQIYHDSNDSYIDDAGTGDLYIKSNKVRLQSTTGENLLFAQENSGVFVYFNNAKKFETTSTGISVTGNGDFSGNVSVPASQYLEAVHTDNTYARLKGNGLFFNRSNVFIAAETDNFATLNLGYSSVRWGNVEINAAATKFLNGSSERMRLDSSGNLGINISNPTAKVEIVNADFTGQFKTAQVGSSNKFGIGSGSAYAAFMVGATGITQFMRAYHDNSIISIGENGANVGIGTISPTQLLHVNSSTSNATGIGLQNSERYYSVRSNNFSLVFNDETVGTERMRITNTGNVGIGTTSPVSKFQIGDFVGTGGYSYGTVSTGYGSFNANRSTLFLGTTDANAINVGGSIAFGGQTGASSNMYTFGSIIGAKENGTSGNYQGYLAFKTTPNNSSLTEERMRLTSTGNLGVGLSNPGARMDVLTETRVSFANASQYTLRITNTDGNPRLLADGDSANLIFGTTPNGSSTALERMRITSAGTICVGKTNDSLNTVGTNVFSGSISLTRASGLCLAANRRGSDGSISEFYKSDTLVGNISVTSSATAYNTSSDYRLKEDLQDFKGLDLVSKIPVYDYKWKADESRSYGVMAHELEEVLPQAVTGDKDAEDMQSVDYSKIVPLLVKSIQELSAKLEALECQCEKK